VGLPTAETVQLRGGQLLVKPIRKSNIDFYNSVSLYISNLCDPTVQGLHPAGTLLGGIGGMEGWGWSRFNITPRSPLTLLNKMETKFIYKIPSKGSIKYIYKKFIQLT